MNSQSEIRDEGSIWRESPVHVVVILATLALGATSLIYPFGRDQANYAYAAWAWLDGAALYQDVAVWKPPLTVLVHAAALSIFDHSMSSIRALDLIWTIAIATSLVLLMRRLGKGRIIAAAAGILYPLLYFQFPEWHTAQTEGWLNLPVVLSFLAATRSTDDLDAGRSGIPWAVASGALLGIACFFKYTAAIFVVPLVLTVATARRGGATWRTLSVRFAAILAGLGAVSALIIVWLWADGALTAFVGHHFTTLSIYAEYAPSHRGIASVEQMAFLFLEPMLRPTGIVLSASFLILVSAEIWKRARNRNESKSTHTELMVLCWLCCGFVAIWVQGRFFEYHYLPLLPPTAVLGAAALGKLQQFALLKRNTIYGVLVALIIVSFAVTTPLRTSFRPLGSVLSGERSLMGFWQSKRFEYGHSSLEQNLHLAYFLAARTETDETVFIWGIEPMVNFLAKRKTMSRYIYNFAFMLPEVPSSHRERLMSELTESPPRFFVISSRDATPAATGVAKDSWQVFQEFEELTEFVGQRYLVRERIGRFVVLERRTD